jgi:hypothetical protein
LSFFPPGGRDENPDYVTQPTNFKASLEFFAQPDLSATHSNGATTPTQSIRDDCSTLEQVQLDRRVSSFFTCSNEFLNITQRGHGIHEAEDAQATATPRRAAS